MTWSQFFRWAVTPVGALVLGGGGLVLIFTLDPESGRLLLRRLTGGVAEILNATLPLVIVITGLGFMVKKVFGGK